MAFSLTDEPSASAGQVRISLPAWAGSAALIVLVILDTITPPGRPLFMAGLAASYLLKTLFAVFILFVGLASLLDRSLSGIYKSFIVIYIIIIAMWFILWISKGSDNSVITYLTNPNFSIFSWTFVLTIPVVARMNVNNGLIRYVGRLPVYPFVALALVSSVGATQFGLRLNATSAGIAALFILACRPDVGMSRIIAFFVSIVVAIAMLNAGYRIYVLGALVFGGNQFFATMTRRNSSAQVFFFLGIPLYYKIFIDYGAKFFGKTSLFYDTRTFLVEEILRDYSTLELIFGRGIDAKYFSPYFRNIARSFRDPMGFSNIWRASSEIGWLNLTMHFGVVSLIPFLFLVTYPVVKDSGTAAIRDSNGLRRFAPVLIALFAVELWNAISAIYLCWFICLGALLERGSR